MQSIVHFLMSIVAGLCIGIHIESKLKKGSVILLLSIAATSIDLDHLFPIYHQTGMKVLHNFFVFIIFPVIIFFIFCIYEKGKKSSIGQRVCMLLCINFVGHMFLDSITETGMPLFYPFGSDSYSLRNMQIAIDSPVFSLSSQHIILIFWGVIICLANILETLTYNEVEKGEPFRIWIKDRRIFKRDKKDWLPTVANSISFKSLRIARNDNAYYNASFEQISPNDEIIESILNDIRNMPD